MCMTAIKDSEQKIVRKLAVNSVTRLGDFLSSWTQIFLQMKTNYLLNFWAQVVSYSVFELSQQYRVQTVQEGH